MQPPLLTIEHAGRPPSPRRLSTTIRRRSRSCRACSKACSCRSTRRCGSSRSISPSCSPTRWRATSSAPLSSTRPGSRSWRAAPGGVPHTQGSPTRRAGRRHDGRGHRLRRRRPRASSRAARTARSAAADKGKALCSGAGQGGCSAAAAPATQAEPCSRRIRRPPTISVLAGCDLVIEAVFEDAAIKAEVTRGAEAVLPPDAIIRDQHLDPADHRAGRRLAARSSSSACISSRRSNGWRWWRSSSVSKTEREHAGGALDFVAQLRKTPIVVNDSRGFYTSRVFQTFIHEGMAMLGEGVAPALIENAARHGRVCRSVRWRCSTRSRSSCR